MDFLAPNHLFWILPYVLIATGVGFWAYRQRKRAISLLTQGAEVCHLKTNASPVRRRILAVSLSLSLILALITVLRPTGGTQISEHRRPAKNIIVLLDISTSMEATDVSGISRIDAAKLLLREFVNKRPTDKIGLVSFAGGTFPECPVTLDRTMLLERINKISPGEIPVGGTDILAALESADQLLTDQPPPGSSIMIVSDGDNVTGANPEKILTHFQKNKIPILSVALGLDQTPVTIPNTDLMTKASHETLRSLSTATNGLFMAASPKEVDSQVSALGARIDTIEIDGTNVAADLYERPLELYAYPLSLALLFLMIHLFLPLRTRSWHPLTAAIALMLALSTDARSEILEDYQSALARAKDEEMPLMLCFTGSDWSEQSITFEREILNHAVFEKWAKAKVVLVIIDLPRVGISDQERTERRELAKKFEVEAYPTSIFIKANEEKIGALGYDPNGPASWIKRAEAILGGDRSQSDTPASIDYLPKEIQESLNAETLTPSQRSIRLFNKAIELEKAEPDLIVSSKDRFSLLRELYQKSAQEAPSTRPDLAFAAKQKSGLLYHRLAKSQTPTSEEEMGLLAMQNRLTPEKLLSRARSSYLKALALYKEAAALKANDQQLSTSLAVAYQDIARIDAYIAFMKGYQKAVATTITALEQEKQLVRALEREVTTRHEINQKSIQSSLTSIQNLVELAEAIEQTPTILPKEGLQDYRLASEDIGLAPSPHRERDLTTAQQHIQDALDHLIDPQQMQPQPQSGSGEGEPQQPGEEEEDGEEEQNEGFRQGDKPEEEAQAGEEEGDQEGNKSDADADLRRADAEKGDLRQRMLRKLGRDGKYIPRSKNH